MANKDHMAILKKGVKTWNQWRTKNPEIRPHLRKADLEGANLRSADLRGADLRDAALTDASLGRADLSDADLSGANLNLADLRRASLIGADLSWAVMFGTDFRHANLKRADLSFGVIWAAKLGGSDLSGAMIRGTTFGMANLSQAKGLEDVRVKGPSAIGIDTIYRSQGQIPESFLRGVGIPENFITFMHSLACKAFDFYSCFISYSSKDQEFAERLHSDLQAKGVRCWYAPEDLKTGDKFRQRIDEAIRIYDKLLVVLSENSIASPWVEEEVEGALEKEHQQNKLALFPVRLDDAVMQTTQAWAASLRRARHISDFTQWKEHDVYQKAFQRLLRDLQDEKAQATAPE